MSDFNIQGIDHGIVLPFKCPSCQTNRQKLIENPEARGGVNAVFKLIRNLALPMPGADKPEWLFMCIGCGLETYIPEQEYEVIKVLCQKAHLFQEGKISQNEYLTYLMNSNCQTVKELYARTKTWDCPECQNEIPATFASCWNCGTECPDPEGLVSFDDRAS